MRNYVLDDKYLVKLEEGSPKGVQEKYLRNGYWYKKDKSGKEGLTEHIVSVLLRCSTLPENCYVYYEHCLVNGGNGCRSKSFLMNEYESFISYERLGKILTGESLNDRLSGLRDYSDRLDLLLKIGKSVNLNMYNYFKVMMYIDMLICNRDRHTRNYGVIYDSKKGVYRIPPIFDNGLSLNTGLSLSDKVHSVTLSGSFEEQVVAFGYPVKSPFKVDYSRVLRELKDINCSEKTVLFDRMRKYESIYRK